MYVQHQKSYDALHFLAALACLLMISFYLSNNQNPIQNAPPIPYDLSLNNQIWEFEGIRHFQIILQLFKIISKIQINLSLTGQHLKIIQETKQTNIQANQRKKAKKLRKMIQITFSLKVIKNRDQNNYSESKCIFDPVSPNMDIISTEQDWNISNKQDEFFNELPKKEKTKKYQSDITILKYQLTQLHKVELENSYDQEKISGNIDIITKILKCSLTKLRYQRRISGNIVKINLNSIFIESQNRNSIQRKVQNNAHKQALSRFEDWQVHLKSLRTQYLQQMFNDFNGKMWKVPNQTLIKQYIFSGSQQNKQKIIAYLEKQKINFFRIYEFFPKRRDFYVNLVNIFIEKIELALLLDGQADDLIFELLFKFYIPNMFE